MLVSKVAFLAVLCGVASVQGAGPGVKIAWRELSMVNTENPVFDPWVASVDPDNDGSTVSITVPVKSELSENVKAKVTMTLNGDALPEADSTLCELMKDKTAGDDIRKALKMSECPVSPGTYEMKNFAVDGRKFSNVPDGKIVGTLQVYMPDEKPFVTAHFEGDLSHEMSVG